MSLPQGHTIAITHEAYAGLTALREDLLVHGTARLPKVLAPTKLTLSEVVLLGVRAARAAMKKEGSR